MDNQHFPAFSAIEAICKNIQETTRVAMQAVIRIKEIVRPVVEYCDTYKKQIAKTMQEMAHVMRPLLAIHKMSDVQFVCWKTMDAAFIDSIIDSQNVNKTLREHLRIYSQRINIHISKKEGGSTGAALALNYSNKFN